STSRRTFGGVGRVLRVVGRRLIEVVVTLVALSVLVFVWLRNLPGGQVSAMLDERATPERRALLEKALGYDQPVWKQYFNWIKLVLSGNFGNSRVGGQGLVLDEIGRGFPATMELSSAALIFAIGLGIPLGYMAARYKGRLLDNTTILGTLVGVAVPVFFLGYVLKVIFTENLHWFPASGRASTGLDATHVTNFFVLDGLITREFDASADAIHHLILPAITLGTI